MSASEIRPGTTLRLSPRAATLQWLRKTHGWLGLWGATLGLLFGVTGIVQNHRAILKLRPQESTVQLALPQPAPADADALAAWLQQSLHLAQKAARIKSEDARPVAWGDQALEQPEHWTAQFNSPRFAVQADYWRGNNFVTVKRSDNGVLATLSSLHKGIGVGIGWVLLADSVAGSLILLSLTGLAMWVLTRRGGSLLGLGVGVLALAAAIGFALQAM